MKHRERIWLFCECIERWFLANRRDLPWRDLSDRDTTQRAYKVLLSEVMLQQTQVPRVIGSFKTFLAAFPNIGALAVASSKEVLLAWRGLGYNSRALRLRDAAKEIVSRCVYPSPQSSPTRREEEKKHQGIPSPVRAGEGWGEGAKISFPYLMKDLLSIPGIGPYTASAIRNFAFDLPTPCIDTNIRRVLHRAFHGPENPDGTWKVNDAKLLPLASSLLSAACSLGMRAADWHAALMDYGSIVQTKRSPKWDLCPLTAMGLMQTTERNFPTFVVRSPKSEPGRMMAGRFVPNRIFRGRIVEELRDAERPMTLPEIGRQVCIDWSAKEHAFWLKGLVSKLVRERLLVERRKKYSLHH